MEDLNDKEATRLFWRWFWVALVAITILSVLGFVTHSAGLFGRTVVERKVFENSYQRSESIKAQIAMDEATLVEIQAQLRNPDLTTTVRSNLEAQASATRMRLAAAKGRQ
jgi:hypothetical protein